MHTHMWYLFSYLWLVTPLRVFLFSLCSCCVLVTVWYVQQRVRASRVVPQVSQVLTGASAQTCIADAAAQHAVEMAVVKKQNTLVLTGAPRAIAAMLWRCTQAGVRFVRLRVVQREQQMVVRCVYW